MRILHLVAGSKWTGPAAVAIEQVAALRRAGIEAEIGFDAASPLAELFRGHGWARPLLSRARGPAAFFKDISRIRETVAREKFDAVHAHVSHDHLIAALALSARIPLVRSYHQQRAVRAGPVGRWLASRNRACAFSNSEIQLKYSDRFGSAVPLTVFPPVIDTERFLPGSRDEDLAGRFHLPPGAFVVGTIGKMEPGRGHDTAIRILARTRNPRIVLLHIGKGPWQEHIRALAAALGMDRRNFETGYQEANLPALYRLMDAFLFTASGSDQGHRAIGEAMGSGVPVVSLDIPGVGDFGIAGRAGFVTATQEEAARALDTLCENRSTRDAMACAGRSLARNLSPGEFARSAIDFYRRALLS